MGYWTIGVGHLLGSSPRMSTITDDECDALYQFDVRLAEARVRSLVPQFLTLTDARQRALVNMSFNRGDHLTHSATILPAIQRAAVSGNELDWQQVPLAIAGSEWARQVKGRAVRIGQMLASGVDP
jgi:lysozyme